MSSQSLWHTCNPVWFRHGPIDLYLEPASKLQKRANTCRYNTELDGFALVMSKNGGTEATSGAVRCTCSFCRCCSFMSRTKLNKTIKTVNHYYYIQVIQTPGHPAFLPGLWPTPPHFSICPELALLPHPFAAAHLQRRAGHCRSWCSVGVKCRPCCLVEVRWPWSLPTCFNKNNTSGFVQIQRWEWFLCF